MSRYGACFRQVSLLHRWAITAAVVVAVLTGSAASAGPPVAQVDSSSSLDGIAGLLLPGVRRAVERGMRVEIDEPTNLVWRQSFRTATDTYHGAVRLGREGTLEGYVAGLPFPAIDSNDVEAGTKIMWNHAFGPWTVDDSAAQTVEWSTGRLRDDAPMRLDALEPVVQHQQSMTVRLIGRTVVEPLHAFENNRERVLAMEALGPTFPPLSTLESNGPLLTYRYLGDRDDDVWYYNPFGRRLRRLSPQVRYNTPGEIIVDVNSFLGFSAPVSAYTWRLLGERELLGVVAARSYPAQWCPEAGDFAACDRWEKRRVFVVEGTSRHPYDAYSKRILAIDRDAWIALASDLYDPDGEFWKTVMTFWTYVVVTGAGGGELRHVIPIAGSAIDYQALRAFRWRWPGERPLAEAVAVNTGLTPLDFSIGRMASAFR